MSFEIANTILGALTLAVIAATAIAALVQLRHLRASNQLQGLLTILNTWEDPEFQRFMDFVRNELEDKVRDPAFMAALAHRPVDRAIHPELHVADMWEQVGSYVKWGLLDERPMLDVTCAQLNDTWRMIWPVIEVMRRDRGDSLYENFEYLAVRGRLWIAAHPGGYYPRRLPRIAQLPAWDSARDRNRDRG